MLPWSESLMLPVQVLQMTSYMNGWHYNHSKLGGQCMCFGKTHALSPSLEWLSKPKGLSL